jgi:hypothetical protein
VQLFGQCTTDILLQMDMQMTQAVAPGLDGAMVLAIVNNYKEEESGTGSRLKKSRLDGGDSGYETRAHPGGEHEEEWEDLEERGDEEDEGVEEENEKEESESFKDENEEVRGYLSVTANWGFNEPWMESGAKEGFKRTMYVALEGNITYVSGKENKVVNQKQVMFAKRVVGVEMKLHLMGQDEIMDCRGYLDTMAGHLRSPIAVLPEYQGTVDLSRVLLSGC